LLAAAYDRRDHVACAQTSAVIDRRFSLPSAKGRDFFRVAGQIGKDILERRIDNRHARAGAEMLKSSMMSSERMRMQP
jgi:hypothetical protein